MADTYPDVQSLCRHQSQNDFEITAIDRQSPSLILAPHGGGIERGTCELARAIAGDDHNLYLFQGKMRSGNNALHITSTRFYETAMDRLLAKADHVLAVHGSKGARIWHRSMAGKYMTPITYIQAAEIPHCAKTSKRT
ncbi:MAG: poly-gamma-glutamate hydrolase family protein [Paracoccaceae bacterium]